MRRAAKRDQSEKSVIETLEACGFTVMQISAKDKPDLLIARGNVMALAEVKTGKAKLKPGQATFAASWPSKVYVLRTPEDVIELSMRLR